MKALRALGQPDTLATADGFALARRRWAAEPARAVVVLVHGFAASTDDGAVVRQAEALQSDGFDVLSYDSRGHGRSGGLCTLGDLESHDVAAAVTWAKTAGLPVVLVGASMGAIAALRYAAAAAAVAGAGAGAAAGEGELAGVVAISAPSSWRAPRSVQGLLMAALTQTRVGRLLAERGMGVRLAPEWSAPETPRQLVRRITVPVAVVHGDRDRFIPASDATEIHRACNSPRRFDLVAGMGHAFDEKALPAVSAAVEWLLAFQAPATEMA